MNYCKKLMEIPTQIKNIIDKSNDILLLAPEEMEGDALGGILALFYTLKKLGKKANLILQNVPEKFRFLPIPEYITSLKAKKNFTICLGSQGDNIAEMRYEKKDGDLKIYFSLKEENFNENNITFEHNELNPDLLIGVGAHNLESFGKIFRENPQVFYDKPLINIDSSPDNENFGEINLVDITSSGVSEIIGDLVKGPFQDLIDDNISTCLLAGLISATQNFHNQKVTPKNLNFTSYLIEKGAQHQKIIQCLFKTKTLGAVRLLGKVLEKLNFSKEKEFYWVSLSQNDFVKTQSSPKNLGDVLEELKLKFLNSSSLLILWEGHNSPRCVRGILYSSKNDLIKKIAENYESAQKGKGVLFLSKNPDLAQTEQEILNLL